MKKFKNNYLYSVIKSLLVSLAVFGGSVNITINWDSWQKLLNSISNVW